MIVDMTDSDKEELLPSKAKKAKYNVEETSITVKMHFCTPFGIGQICNFL